jgi:hypothetical protein
MIYRGRVVKGAILLETGVAFPEGAEIRIEVIDPAFRREQNAPDALSAAGTLEEDSAEAIEESVPRARSG